MLAALTVAIVALPLSMAIACRLGRVARAGLYAAVIGGFFVSALGGSRYPDRRDPPARSSSWWRPPCEIRPRRPLLTVFISGFMLTLIGLLRLGSLIRYIPHAVTVGFTCGIAVTIFASQLEDLGGLNLSAAEPGHAVAEARRAWPRVANAQSCRARRRCWLGRADLPAAAARRRTGREC